MAKNHYLLMAAMSALMIASCSDDTIVDGGGTYPPQSNTLKLNTLSASSQAGRVVLPKDARGIKADRLEFVAQIDPIAGSDAADFNWSATGIAINGGSAYVTWHSNHQASNPSEVWGGALDVISIANIVSGENVIANTVTTRDQKFNSVSVVGSNLFVAATDLRKGAAVSRIALAGEGVADELQYLAIPGTSANAVAANGADIVVVSGYKGAAVQLPAAFTAESELTYIKEASETFGGKYVDGGYILRTDDANGQLIAVADGSERNLDVPLTSSEKYSETYDPETGEWSQSASATHYGKHTMAVNGGYAYVAAGKNGLRVYDLASSASAAAWSNKTNTNGVCADDKYVYAATSNGLRVYEKKEGGALELFAYEVDQYAADGTADSSASAANGHSPNFVAVDEATGYIFVAYGQTGVRVYKLNENPDQPDPNQTVKVTLTIPDINHSDEQEVVKGGDAAFEIPGDTPDVPEGKVFIGWSTDPENPDAPVYKPGDIITIPAGEEDSNTVLSPVTADELSYTITFDINTGVGDVPADMVVKGYPAPLTSEALPGADGFSKANHTFLGWATTADATAAQYKAGDKVALNGNVKLYAVWSQNAYTYDFTVTFDIEDATGDKPADIHVQGYTEEDCKVTLPGQGNIDQDGYTFKGWATVPWDQQTPTTPVYNGDYTVTGDVTLYPVWTAKGSGGTAPGTGEVEG